ncbi:MAG: VCBS repeat-containing protein [Myxococcales bacterium]|nr:VCBS repeat-containing protein [Myxococcales bacterium]
MPRTLLFLCTGLVLSAGCQPTHADADGGLAGGSTGTGGSAAGGSAAGGSAAGGAAAGGSAAGGSAAGGAAAGGSAGGTTVDGGDAGADGGRVDGGSDAGAGDAGAPDSGTVADAGPLLGNACPTQLVEVGRLPAVDFFATTFAPAYYSVASNQLYTEDVTGDGRPDLLAFETLSNTTSRVRLFEGLGALAFGAEVTSTLTLPRYGVEFNLLGDFDGNGRKDLLLGYTTELPRTTYVYVALQNSQGQFVFQSFRRDLGVCGSSGDERRKGVTVLDLNADGRDDVLATVSLEGLGSSPVGLSLLMGSASGLGAASCLASIPRTAPRVSSPSLVTAGFPQELAYAELLRVGDFNGDGRLDLFAGLGHLSFYPAMGYFPRLEDGGFRSTFDGGVFVSSIQRWQVRRADDATRHLALTSSVQSVGTFLTAWDIGDVLGVSQGRQLVTLPIGDATGSEAPFGFALNDLNGDRRTDLLVIGNQGLGTGTTPMPFAIACDRAARWEIDGGFFPAYTRLLRPFTTADGGVTLAAMVDQDLIFYRLQ